MSTTYGGQITDIGISAIAHGCPLLSTINLAFCIKITDVGISAIARGCPLLKKISLTFCVEVTDIGISALAHGCPLLRSINPIAFRKTNIVEERAAIS